MKAYLFGLLLTAVSMLAHGTAITNCTSDENVVFSCVANKKVISVCTSSQSSTNGYLEYRFSLARGKPVFSYRADADHPDRLFQRAELDGASSSSTVIWFENNGYAYIINDPLKGFPSISVRQDKKEVSKLQCTGEFEGDMDIASPYIQEKTSNAYFDLFRP